MDQKDLPKIKFIDQPENFSARMVGEVYQQVSPFHWAEEDWNNDGDVYEQKVAKFQRITSVNPNSNNYFCISERDFRDLMEAGNIQYVKEHMRVCDRDQLDEHNTIYSVSLGDQFMVTVKVCDTGLVYIMQNADGSTVYNEADPEQTFPGYVYDQDAVLRCVKEHKHAFESEQNEVMAMKSVGDGFFVNSYRYYSRPEGELRYQIIYSARDEGHKNIENSVAAHLESVDAALCKIEEIKQDPDWKVKLESKLISFLLNGCTVRYQLENFEQVFADWSDHEKALALKILTERAEKIADKASGRPSLSELITNAKSKQQVFKGPNERPSHKPER